MKGKKPWYSVSVCLIHDNSLMWNKEEKYDNKNYNNNITEGEKNASVK